MAKISKEEIRKKLQQQTQPKQLDNSKPESVEKTEQETSKDQALSKDLKYLGLTTGIIIVLLVAIIIIKNQTELFNQSANFFFQFLNLS